MKFPLLVLRDLQSAQQKQTKENHIMKKITLSALAVLAVAGTSFAGTTVVSKEYKQPCVTPCFRDQEWQLDLFYSFNDASHQGSRTARDTVTTAPETTPITPGVNSILPRSSTLLENTSVIPTGSTVIRSRTTSASLPQYFSDGSGGGVGLSYFFYRYIGIGVEGNWWDGCRGGFNGNFTTTDAVTTPVPYDPVAVLAAARANNTSVTFVNANALVLATKGDFGHNHKSAANQVTGSLILRYPFEGPICWAPYIFGGGGGIWDGQSTGFDQIGLGVEFRVTPYMGFFTDWRWEFMSGGSSNDNGFRDSSAFRQLVNAVGAENLRHLEDLNGHKRNDVSMTRMGVRFVF